MKKIIFNDDEQKDIIKMYLDFTPINQIREKYGVSKKRIYDVLKDNNIDLHGEKTKFSWNASQGANNYYLRIWNESGDKEVVTIWGTDGKLSWDIQLDEGKYNAQIGAVNGDIVTWSKFELFEVKECNHTYTETTVAATCTTDGKTEKKCTNCGDTITSVIKSTGHKYGEWTISKKSSQNSIKISIS